MTADVVAAVAAAVDLSEGKQGVADVLRTVARHEPVAVREISREVDLPVPLVAAICNELRKLGVISDRRPVQFTGAGRARFGRPIRRRRDLAAITKELKAVVRGAPPARMELDQAHCTYETKLRRVLELEEAGCLDGAHVVLLGDDDLTSLALKVAPTEPPRAVTVVEVDAALVRFLRAALAGAPFRVDVLEHDLRDPLPDELRGAADTVFTDPPYTAAGAALFLSRAAEATADERGRHVFFAYGASRPEELLATQRAIAEMGFVVRRLERNFNEYVGAGAIGGTSHLYELATTRDTRPLVAGRYDGPLYTGDRREPVRLYRCAACAAVHRVGRDRQWKTIGELKDTGCRRCGGGSFTPLPRRDG